MRTLCRLHRPPVVVTIRDPRDCVASLMTQFGHTFPSALSWVARSAELVMKLTDVCPFTLFRYEDGDSRRLTGLQRLAECLGVDPGPERLAALYAELSPTAVAAFIGDLVRTGHFDDRPPGDQWHAETQWHPNHVGDGAVGKYGAVLTPAQSALVAGATRAFRERFGYPVEAPLLGSVAEIDLAGEGCLYLGDGFSAPEPWGAWTDKERATLSLPLAGPAGVFRLQMQCVTGPAFRGAQGERVVSVDVGGEVVAVLNARPAFPRELVLALSGNAAGGQVLELGFRFERLASPVEAGEGSDARALGLGISRLSLSYDPVEPAAEEPTVRPRSPAGKAARSRTSGARSKVRTTLRS